MQLSLRKYTLGQFWVEHVAPVLRISHPFVVPIDRPVEELKEMAVIMKAIGAAVQDLFYKWLEHLSKQLKGRTSDRDINRRREVNIWCAFIKGLARAHHKNILSELVRLDGIVTEFLYITYLW